MAKPTKIVKEEFAQSRSNDASKAAYDLCKVIAQTCLLINGGAATAVIALLGKEKVDQNLLTYVPVGLALYAIGVVVGAYMLYCVMMVADNWNFHWQNLGYELNQKAADEYEAVAEDWQKWMMNSFGWAIACFVLASGFVAYGMWQSLPTVKQVATPAAITAPLDKPTPK